MKKLFFVMTAIACIALSSCSKDNVTNPKPDNPDNPPSVKKRVTQIFDYEDGPDKPNYTKFLTYDAKGRLSEFKEGNSEDDLKTHIITYDDQGRLTKEDISGKHQSDNKSVSYSYKDNTISVSDGQMETASLNIDAKGKMISSERNDKYKEQYTYDDKNGNLIKKVGNHGTDNYIYDQKSSPFRYQETPKWFLLYSDLDNHNGNNNCISDQFASEPTDKFEYDYDKDGYATKMYWVDAETGKRDGSFIEYKYEEIKD